MPSIREHVTALNVPSTYNGFSVNLAPPSIFLNRLVDEINKISCQYGLGNIAKRICNIGHYDAVNINVSQFNYNPTIAKNLTNEVFGKISSIMGLNRKITLGTVPSSGHMLTLATAALTSSESIIAAV